MSYLTTWAKVPPADREGILEDLDYEYDIDDPRWADSVVDAVCLVCGAVHDLEPDADGYYCDACDASASVSSVLVILGFI